MHRNHLVLISLGVFCLLSSSCGSDDAKNHVQVTPCKTTTDCPLGQRCQEEPGARNFCVDIPANPQNPDDNPCERITCQTPPPSCKEGSAVTFEGGDRCNPATGRCDPPTETHNPCQAAGLSCVDGACVSRCAELECPVPENSCSRDTLTVYSGGCSEEEGRCLEVTQRIEDCAAAGQTCFQGSCQGAEGMIAIPEGTFTMGNNREDGPQREVYLDAYLIDVYEVTTRLYRECVDAGVCSRNTPENVEDCHWGIDWSNYPMNCVSWEEARTYCAWKNKRLPTEAEWEKAARGTDGRTYPWGEETATCGRAIMDDENAGGEGCGRNHAWVVGDLDEGKSPYGLHDTAGNVQEWVADWFDFETYTNDTNTNPKGPVSGDTRSVRGGGWRTIPLFLEVTYRYSARPDTRENDLGFRCAKDYTP